RLKAMTAKQTYTQGDHLHVVVHIENIMETAKTVDLYKILHYSSGDLYIKSDGSFSVEPVYEQRTLSAYYRQVDTIFDLTLPDTLPSENYEFTARMTEPETTNLVCPDSIITFSFRNFPHAEFTVDPKTGKRMVTIFYVDATGSSDVEDFTPLLKVRWQWESGFDFTAWSTVKKAQHKYPSTGSKVIILEVRDLDGNVSSATQTITVTE
ncbi:PKD domain-containing protein, partial [bacterium]|nr:PKD domain-containing protein [bacterium]